MPAGEPAAAMNCLDVPRKEGLVGGCDCLVRPAIAAALRDGGLEHRHLQQTFAATCQAEAARLAATEADTGIRSAHDQVIDENSPDRKLRSQSPRFGLGPKYGRGQHI